MPRILIAASGTGGHIFPALAVAESLPKFWTIYWLGVSDRIESKLLPHQYELSTLQVGGLQGSFLKKVWSFIKLVGAIPSVIAVIKSKDIDIIFTTGGYIAAPVILGAKLCRVKVLLHESNAFPGRVTRSLGRFCDLVALGFPDAIQYLNGCRTSVTGTPVRDVFFRKHSLPSWVPLGEGPLVVVMGGSQGAIGLNQMVRHTFDCLLKQGCRIVHLTGEKDRESSSWTHPNLVTKSFTGDIPGLLQHADLAICRAGAGTISELAICQTPAILVPYPFASDKHQDFNAAFCAENGGGLIIHQQQKSIKFFEELIIRLLKNLIDPNSSSEDLLYRMKKGMDSIAIKDSKEKLVDILISYL